MENLNGMTATKSKNRSRNAIPETPAHWQHVNIVEDGFDDYKLTVGIFDSLVDTMACAAAGIPRANGLTIQDALLHGGKFDLWMQKQEKKK